jgi:hypothetical protein
MKPCALQLPAPHLSSLSKSAQYYCEKQRTQHYCAEYLRNTPWLSPGDLRRVGQLNAPRTQQATSHARHIQAKARQLQVQQICWLTRRQSNTTPTSVCGCCKHTMGAGGGQWVFKVSCMLVLNLCTVPVTNHQFEILSLSTSGGVADHTAAACIGHPADRLRLQKAQQRLETCLQPQLRLCNSASDSAQLPGINST